MREIRSMAWLLVVLLFGCAAGSAPNILEVKQSGVKKVEINDSALDKAMTFGEVSLRTLAQGVEAQVMIRNVTRRDVAFEYRFIWYDAQGIEVSSSTAWIPAILDAGLNIGVLKSTAPTATAVDFKLMVRSPRPLTDMR
ncbi:MAG TPA: YcfL family protein [Deltaproteobacteria bacterium]|nr:YcfL family protein [Deltaproteobacteria bacterium]